MRQNIDDFCIEVMREERAFLCRIAQLNSSSPNFWLSGESSRVIAI